MDEEPQWERTPSISRPSFSATMPHQPRKPEDYCMVALPCRQAIGPTTPITRSPVVPFDRPEGNSSPIAATPISLGRPKCRQLSMASASARAIGERHTCDANQSSRALSPPQAILGTTLSNASLSGRGPLHETDGTSRDTTPTRVPFRLSARSHCRNAIQRKSAPGATQHTGPDDHRLPKS